MNAANYFKPQSESSVSKSAVSIGLDHFVNVVMEDHETYTSTAFISDVGGTAGLFLGLSIIGISFLQHSHLHMILGLLKTTTRAIKRLASRYFCSKNSKMTIMNDIM